jgi:hypothetical protein
MKREGAAYLTLLKLPYGQKVELLSGGATSNALTVNPIKL